MIAIAGPLRGAAFALSNDELSLGRSKTNTIALVDRSVSRHHCVVRQEEGRFHLLDLQSINGTYVNGKSIQEHWLEPGDEIRAGQSIFLFSVESEHPRRTGQLEKMLLQHLQDAFPAQRVSIALTNGEKRTAGIDARLSSVGSGVVEQAMRDGTAVLCRTDNGALAAPLITMRRTLGAICADACQPGQRFDEDHLQLLAAIALSASSAVENVLRQEELREENRRLRKEIEIEHDLIGDTEAMQNVYSFIGKVAPTDATVLLRGESGTGKELVARAIHRNSKRTERPFAAINCAALSETLLESELFGHEKGAFTGAHSAGSESWRMRRAALCFWMKWGNWL